MTVLRMLPVEGLSRLADLLDHPVAVALLDQTFDSPIEVARRDGEVVAALDDLAVLRGSHLDLVEATRDHTHNGTARPS